MNRIVAELSAAGTFYIATVEDAQPRVRPFGAVIEYEGAPYLCTNNQKSVFKQLAANPRVEICGMKQDGTWVRVTGNLVRDDSAAARAAMLEGVPSLRRMYSVDDGIFEVLRLENATAMLYSFGADPVVITE